MIEIMSLAKSRLLLHCAICSLQYDDQSNILVLQLLTVSTCAAQVSRLQQDVLQTALTARCDQFNPAEGPM